MGNSIDRWMVPSPRSETVGSAGVEARASDYGSGGWARRCSRAHRSFQMQLDSTGTVLGILYKFCSIMPA